MKRRVLVLLLPVLSCQTMCLTLSAQKLRRADRQLSESLHQEIGFLAGDSLQGRRAGSAGEKAAANYIVASFTKSGLKPLGDNRTWFQPFPIYDGKDISGSHLSINSSELASGTDYFPLGFSASASAAGEPAVALQESGMPWFYDIRELVDEGSNNPHYDIDQALREKARSMETKGATAVLFYNSGKSSANVRFNDAEDVTAEKIPVVFITEAGRKKYLKDISQSIDVALNIHLSERKRTGNNVVGYLDRGATTTVVIGAHYDHLGYGEDGNSLYRGAERQIHHGADDNASGTAALMELARIFGDKKGLRSNYLFIAFSGEESGLLGSKYFTLHPTVPLEKLTYMINMDMVGRFNDSTHVLTVGGFGTSPAWPALVSASLPQKEWTLHFDSSGTGPSDHTSFYQKQIPVLFFFTGMHSDYHKPTDEASKINYNGEVHLIRSIAGLMAKMDGKPRPAFTKTRDNGFGDAPAFTVTLGFMPDYSYSGTGVRVDAVTEGRTAETAGIQAGDIITRLGNYSVTSLQTYMEALSRFNPKDKTTVVYLRNNTSKEASIQFR